jgi:hypothetical protein
MLYWKQTVSQISVPHIKIYHAYRVKTEFLYEIIEHKIPQPLIESRFKHTFL